MSTEKQVKGAIVGIIICYFLFVGGLISAMVYLAYAAAQWLLHNQ